MPLSTSHPVSYLYVAIKTGASPVAEMYLIPNVSKTTIYDHAHHGT